LDHDERSGSQECDKTNDKIWYDSHAGSVSSNRRENTTGCRQLDRPMENEGAMQITCFVDRLTVQKNQQHRKLISYLCATATND